MNMIHTKEEQLKINLRDIKCPTFRSEIDARRLGYVPLITECTESECWIAANVMDDMKRGGIDHCCVVRLDRKGEILGIQVFRRGYSAISSS